MAAAATIAWANTSVMRGITSGQLSNKRPGKFVQLKEAGNDDCAGLLLLLLLRVTASTLTAPVGDMTSLLGNSRGLASQSSCGRLDI